MSDVNTLIEVYTEHQRHFEDAPGSALHGKVDGLVILGVHYIGPEGAGEIAFSFSTGFAMLLADAIVEAAQAAFPDSGTDE